MTSPSTPDIKFPGLWEWLGIACQGGVMSVAHVGRLARGDRGFEIQADGMASPRVLGVWRFNRPEVRTEKGAKTESPSNAMEDQIASQFSTLKQSLGERMVKKLASSVVLEDANYEIVTVDDPELTNVTEAQRTQALRWSIQPLVTFDVSRASIDTIIPSGAGRKKLTIAAAPESSIAPWVLKAVSERVNLRAIDVRETAQRNLAHLLEDGNNAMGLLVLAGSRALLTLSAGGELLMTRRIEMGSLEAGTKDPKTRDRIGLEVQRTLDNFERQSGRASGTQLFVSAGEHSPALAHHLRVELGLAVKPIDEACLSDALQIEAEIRVKPAEWGYLELMAIGAACRGVEGR